MNITDRSGYVVFSGGDLGAAHVMAHRLLDAGRVERGREWLGQWLAGRTGDGSDWAHIQFHMAVFEIESGDLHAARRRYLAELLPIAAATDAALTDGPALAWRLGLRAGRGPVPGWQQLRQTALRVLDRADEPFVELHKLLALAGARDTATIDRWLRHRRGATPDVVVGFGTALRDYTLRTYRRAADRLRELVPEIPSIGGSGAQNSLFGEIRDRLALAGGNPAAAR